MIETNQLLTIAFALISSFADTVQIPAEHVPRRLEDIGRIVVGSPGSPVDVYLVHKRGDQFWIHNGVVEQYESPDSYFNLSSISARSRLVGPPMLTTNDAVEKATQIMKRLVKTGDTFTGIAPSIKSSAGDVHFYYVSWPTTNLPYRNGFFDVCNGYQP